MRYPDFLSFFRWSTWQQSLLLVMAVVGTSSDSNAAVNSVAAFEGVISPFVQQFCVDCHGSEKEEGDLNLEALLEEASITQSFKTWELVLDMVEFEDMPPIEETQPEAEERDVLIGEISKLLDHAIHQDAGDPGEVELRRLTSAEYAYTIQDLTGLDLDVSRSFVGEAVGGEGFSNVGDVQFMQDAILERYLEAAKTVASHVLVGAGPLDFYQDPGKTGQELSAINRINEIYRRHGFRTGAGEGAKAYGLDQYEKAFFAAWRFKHKETLGIAPVRLSDLAIEEGISPQFLQHIWGVVSDPNPSFPSNEIVAQWKALPQPANGDSRLVTAVREACALLYSDLQTWQRTLAASTIDDEEYAVLTEDTFESQKAHTFNVRMNGTVDAVGYTEFEIFVRAAADRGTAKPLVLWKNPRFRTRGVDDTEWTDYPLREVVAPETAELVNFGIYPDGSPTDPNDFVTHDSTHLTIRFALPTTNVRVQFVAEAQIDTDKGDPCLIRCEITDGNRARETISSTGFNSALLADPESPQMEEWKRGIVTFAQNLPQTSHRGAAPSDRDRIPEPFDNTYNEPERNYYHTAIKYHRDDRFLTEKMLDPETAAKLDEAWTDLLTAFDYHDTIFRFICRKYELGEPYASIADIEESWVTVLESEPRQAVETVFQDFKRHQEVLKRAQSRHLREVLYFAAEAWRRPLRESDRNRLLSYYERLQGEKEQSHEDSLRTLVTRILIAPEFLYRIENPMSAEPVVPLSNYALASRLSYFLWSTKPDAELLRAAAAGELSDADNLAAQARRMLGDPKARRFATEFFGQWFGFYRFDDFTGIDSGHFSEFDDRLKSSMYNEAISFFEYIVTEDRSVDDILFADYSFLNPNLAAHYGIPWDSLTVAGDGMTRVTETRQFKRGGLLQLGAVLAVTSAPLRTSAVKRGDWVLRRVLGTPTPSPPADVGSIPAEEVSGDGKSVRERLEAHRSDSSCMNCHTRIDPLGFALEKFDPIGRWREQYQDGIAIDTAGILHDGTEVEGLEDLHAYLKQEEATVHRNLCRKLLGYALGRSELLSDRLLIDRMLRGLQTDRRFSNLITQVVTSKQFRHQRGRNLEAASIPSRTTEDNQDSEI